MNIDPYSTPIANPHGTSILGVSGTVSAAAVEQLAATKPWVRFISVLTFIGAGFMLIAAVGMVMMGMMGGLGKIPGNPANHLFSGAMGFGLAALYALLSIIYIFPGVKLWKYADSIALLINSGRNDDLVAALNQQRSFWKFVGILMISIMVVYVIVIIGAVAIAGIAATKLH